ncbi:fatty acid desaturase family protein [Acetobacter fallax]|uniref:Fatty acid desaturase n=1 Tax=Acetobacter fallax TaxID=1737473 RepID=A0ABX0K7K9_9PROT|nr:fatty acid desaturase [Acetobacter fallax]NHO31778.1 fatty acid desaturase [Acetobacter fallax]NHO35460.1 fatty acid desaturase [Acetobacter fallax]
MLQTRGFETVSPEVIKSIKSYQKSDVLVSLYQVISSVSAFVICYGFLLFSVKNGYLSALFLSPLASGLAIRVFILQHDCGHGSLFRSQRVNNFVGRLCSLLTFTPYDHWKKHHSIHHGSWNNVDNRGRLSDLYSDCTTVSEYMSKSRFGKVIYKISKNPVFTIFIMPPIIFFVVYRIAFDTPVAWLRERIGLYVTNICLLLIYWGLIEIFGLKTVFLVAFSVIYPASVIGVWLFLVQHKFEGVKWASNTGWNMFDAATGGCSFLKLPSVLKWFSGNIGIHHVHHAAPGIPNYRLNACHEAHEVFATVKVLNLRDGIREAFTNTLWDEEKSVMVSLRSVR